MLRLPGRTTLRHLVVTRSSVWVPGPCLRGHVLAGQALADMATKTWAWHPGHFQQKPGRSLFILSDGRIQGLVGSLLLGVARRAIGRGGDCLLTDPLVEVGAARVVGVERGRFVA